MEILKCFVYNQHFVAMMNIINYAKMTNKAGNFEKHHIIPRCYFKKHNLKVDNSESNIVKLTLEQHRKVHKLASLCANYEMRFSLKCAVALMNRNWGIGVWSGKNLSKEHKKKLSLAHKGKKLSDETKNKMSKSHLGKHTTAKGKHWKIINGTRVWYTEVKNVDK